MIETNGLLIQTPEHISNTIIETNPQNTEKCISNHASGVHNTHIIREFPYWGKIYLWFIKFSYHVIGSKGNYGMRFSKHEHNGFNIRSNNSNITPNFYYLHHGKNTSNIQQEHHVYKQKNQDITRNKIGTMNALFRNNV